MFQLALQSPTTATRLEQKQKWKYCTVQYNIVRAVLQCTVHIIHIMYSILEYCSYCPAARTVGVVSAAAPARTEVGVQTRLRLLDRPPDTLTATGAALEVHRVSAQTGEISGESALSWRTQDASDRDSPVLWPCRGHRSGRERGWHCQLSKYGRYGRLLQAAAHAMRPARVPSTY